MTSWPSRVPMPSCSSCRRAPIADGPSIGGPDGASELEVRVAEHGSLPLETVETFLGRRAVACRFANPSGRRVRSGRLRDQEDPVAVLVAPTLGNRLGFTSIWNQTELP